MHDGDVDLKTMSINEINRQWSKRNAKKIKEFEEQNPGRPLPIIKTKDGFYKWVNRKERRKRKLRS